MSFLEEVISISNKIELKTILEQSSNIIKKSADLESELFSYLDDVFVTFSTPLEKNNYTLSLGREAKSAMEEVAKLKESVNNITFRNIDASIEEINHSKGKLLETHSLVNVLNNLINIHDGLVEVTAYRNEKNYVAVLKKLQELDEKIRALVERQKDLGILNTITDKIKIQKTLFYTEIQRVYDAQVKLIECKSHTSIEILSDDLLKKIITVLSLSNEYVPQFVKFAKFLLDSVFSKIINFKTSVDLSENKGAHVLKINTLDETKKDNYKKVFNNIEMVLKYLRSHFNFTIRDDLTTIRYIGNQIQAELSELLIRDCLSDTIPTNKEELNNYKSVLQKIERIQGKLVDCGVFSSDTTPLLDYANNVDAHFINKKCEEYLLSATAIMKKDLHEMQEVGKSPDPSNPFTADERDYPQKCVSKSCLELIGLTEAMMRMVLESSDVCGGRLLTTVKNIFYGYGDNVREHHQKFLQTIPQQVALFYNNCDYIAHTLVDWNDKYRGVRTLLSLDHVVFPDEAQKLRLIGGSVFSEFLERQIELVDYIMRDSGLQGPKTLQELPPTVEKSIRQSLRQQELLRTVWFKVLSSVDYNNSIGKILDYVCGFVISGVVGYEDISSDAGELLVDALRLVLTRGPKLFADPKDVYVYAKNWYKFNELVFALTASLDEISERWADGKGPLALYFEVEELRQLIRALFQNSDRRASVLARIKV